MALRQDSMVDHEKVKKTARELADNVGDRLLLLTEAGELNPVEALSTWDLVALLLQRTSTSERTILKPSTLAALVVVTDVPERISASAALSETTSSTHPPFRGMARS